VCLFTSATQIYKMSYLRLWLKINMARHLTLGVQFFSYTLCSLLYLNWRMLNKIVFLHGKIDANKMDKTTYWRDYRKINRILYTPQVFNQYMCCLEHSCNFGKNVFVLPQLSNPRSMLLQRKTYIQYNTIKILY
jgi:hypothetical protein